MAPTTRRGTLVVAPGARSILNIKGSFQVRFNRDLSMLAECASGRPAVKAGHPIIVFAGPVPPAAAVAAVARVWWRNQDRLRAAGVERPTFTCAETPHGWALALRFRTAATGRRVPDADTDARRGFPIAGTRPDTWTASAQLLVESALAVGNPTATDAQLRALAAASRA